MHEGVLGKEYAAGQVICRQGEPGQCMYVVQSGRVEILSEDGGEVALTELAAGDIFGEMALFDRQVRSATARAKDPCRVLTLDKRTFLRRVHEDPSFAYRILQGMSRRIRSLTEELSQHKRAHPSGHPNTAA